MTLPAFQDAPTSLWNLLQGSRKTKYLTYARQFNHAFAYASFKCFSATLPGAYSDMRIQGAAYCATSGIRAENFGNANYIQVDVINITCENNVNFACTHVQIFFTSADEISCMSQVINKTRLNNDSVTHEILRILREALHNDEVSPIWNAYSTADQMFVCVCD